MIETADDRLFRAVCGALGVEPDEVRPRWSRARVQAEAEWKAIWRPPVRKFEVERRTISVEDRRRRQQGREQARAEFQYREFFRNRPAAIGAAA